MVTAVIEGVWGGAAAGAGVRVSAGVGVGRTSEGSERTQMVLHPPQM